MIIEFLIPFVSAFTVFTALHWFVFAKPYKKVKDSRQRLREAKREAEKVAQIPINNPYPIIQITLNGEILFANPAAYEKYPGLEEKVFSHQILVGLEDFIARVKKSKQDEIMTREMVYNDIVYHQTICCVQVNDRQALVIYCYDITNIKAVQEKARLLEAAIVNAKDGVIITNADLENPKILYVNEGATRISGYSAEELIGQTPRMLQGPSTNQQTLTILRETLERGKSFNGELQNYTKDGVCYWLEISISPVKDEEGVVTHFTAIERDITQRKAFEKEMQINREAAEVANRAKGDFLANMSHELRTPMNGIIGLSELLMEMNMTDEQIELADAVNSSSRNLLILLNDILDLSKIEAGELTLEHIPYETRRIVRQTVDLVNPIASRKGVEVKSNINSIVPDRLMGDPARMQQIMNNLISNAIKFTEVGHVRIDVTSARDNAGDPELHIRIEDTGIGIPQNKLESIFHKFTQADVSTARKYGGTGLGLAITKELVEIMGGIIKVDSVEGKGTTFYVEIPVEVAEQDAPAEQKAQNIVAINTNAKIMVVDDHTVNLLFMRKVLKKIGFADADEACSGKEAIEMAEQNKYDLIFMDCQMPEIDGFEASTIIRDREELIGDIKIIAVTADAMKGAREKCLDSGMNDYISKPVDVEKLKAVLSEWIPGDLGSTTEEMQPVTETIEENSAPVSKDLEIMDWERFRMFTDGDPEEERELINIFITYAEESLEILEQSSQEGQDTEWQKAAHKLKGSAANLGAHALSHVCLEAENSATEDEDTKKEILERLKSAYEEIKSVLTADKVML